MYIGLWFYFCFRFLFDLFESPFDLCIPFIVCGRPGMSFASVAFCSHSHGSCYGCIFEKNARFLQINVGFGIKLSCTPLHYSIYLLSWWFALFVASNVFIDVTRDMRFLDESEIYFNCLLNHVSIDSIYQKLDHSHFIQHFINKSVYKFQLFDFTTLGLFDDFNHFQESLFAFCLSKLSKQ